VTLYRYLIPTHPAGEGKAWAKAKYVRHHRAVFHVPRFRTRGLSFVFGGGKTPYFSDVVVRWKHAKVGRRQEYRRHNRTGGWCWAGTRKRRVDLTIKLQYIEMNMGATPETVARVWLARAASLTIPITKHNRMPRGVNVFDTDTGQRCLKKAPDYRAETH
jgi:hypothetical protein